MANRFFVLDLLPVQPKVHSEILNQPSTQAKLMILFQG